MKDVECDVAIVGSGIAGAFCGYFLAKQGIRVVLFEAGPRVERSEIVDAFRRTYKLDYSAGYPNTELAPRPDTSNPDDNFILNDGPVLFRPEYLKLVGGTTWHWVGGATRLHPEDFAMKTRFSRGKDWPVNYDDIEPYYTLAEQELGVSGAEDVENSPPRSKPYPMRPSPYNSAARYVADRLQPHGIAFKPFIAARNTTPYDGRPRCVGYNSCMPICPIGAMYNGIVHVEKAEAAGARVLDETLVTRLIVDRQSKHIEKLELRNAAGETGICRAKVFILAANGLENPRLLLLSASEKAANGLANSSDQVGRNLMDHPGYRAEMYVKNPVYPGRGPAYLTTCQQFANGPARRNRAAFRIGISNQARVNEIAVRLLSAGLSGAKLDQQLRNDVVRLIVFDLAIEQLPDAENRIVLDKTQKDSSGMNKMRITYSYGDYDQRGVEESQQVMTRIAKYLKATDPQFSKLFPHGHLMGTTAMGDNPKTSVVDKNNRTHDHPNLFIAGSSVFPTGSVTPPTLMIAALSIRMAETIARQLAE